MNLHLSFYSYLILFGGLNDYFGYDLIVQTGHPWSMVTEGKRKLYGTEYTVLWLYCDKSNLHSFNILELLKVMQVSGIYYGPSNS